LLLTPGEEIFSFIILLLNHGANMNVLLQSGMFPLIHASATGQSREMIRLLLRFRASPRFVDKNGDTALPKAIEGNHVHVVQELIAAEGDLLWKALALCVSMGREDTWRAILGRELDQIEYRDYLLPYTMERANHLLFSPAKVVEGLWELQDNGTGKFARIGPGEDVVPYDRRSIDSGRSFKTCATSGSFSNPLASMMFSDQENRSHDGSISRNR
jgi:hypothetical protein